MTPAKSVCALTMLAAILAASPTSAGDGPQPVGPKLPAKVRGLLIQEMNAVLDATHDILDALVRGRDEVVAEKAQAIHDSFILKQEMTAADRRAFRDAVPEAFVARDKAFHELTADLAEAARDRDRARQHRLFRDMTEACTACHARYAPNRFPGFGE
ncbi:Cytochrome C' [Limimonas halophila]|uniref:Cytochrome C n=1 Tax=Limimonas halophila TaxID=1082479 RepID=A0A1G7QRA2_9PROT|nr:cytochrome c [Limimonas halophila]SDG01013.1 Cytochrome C' [Limimonas halophila]